MKQVALRIVAELALGFGLLATSSFNVERGSALREPSAHPRPPQRWSER